MRRLTTGLAAALLLVALAGCDYGWTDEEATAVETGALRVNRLRGAGPVAPPTPESTTSQQSTVRTKAREVPVQPLGAGAAHYEQTPNTYPGIGTPIPPGDDP